MVSTLTPVCNFGWQAPDFDLPGVDGGRHTLQSAAGPNGLLVMFICNHCPYVKSILSRLVEDCKALQARGIGVIAIMSNDPEDYPEDSWPEMVRISKQLKFSFPYVLDETQSVAKSYDAVCTPDFFGFNSDLKLQYRGRFDASRKDAAPEGSKRELLEGMTLIAQTNHGPLDQTPSMGCSIKWRSSSI